MQQARARTLSDRLDVAFAAVRLRLRPIVGNLLIVFVACGIVNEVVVAVNGGSCVPTAPQGALLLVTLFYLLNGAYVLVTGWHTAHRWTPDEAADYGLVIMITMSPIVNTLSVFALAEQGFNDLQRSWPGFLGAVLMVSIVAQGIKPQHSMVQILLFAPWITWMEYYQCCSLTSSCTKLGLLAHAMVALPKCLIIGLSICTAGHLMIINWCIALDRDAYQRQAHALPLSSLFKTNALARVPGLTELLSRYQAAVLWLSDNVAHSALVRCVSFPGLSYYLFRTLCARFNPRRMSVSTVPAEEWILALVFAVFVGRDSATLDLGDMQRALKRSIAIMSDLVPEHVVNMLLQVPDDLCPLVYPQVREQSQIGVGARKDSLSGAVGNTDPWSEVGVYGVPGMQQAQSERPSVESSGGVSSRSALLSSALFVELRNNIRGTQLPASASDLRHTRRSTNSLAATSPPAPADVRLGKRTITKNASFGSLTGVLAEGSGGPSSNSGAMRVMLSLKQYLATGSSSDSIKATPHEAGKEGAQVNVAEWHDCVTIFFSDIVGFSSWAHDISPEKVMQTLNDLYCRLDNIIVDEMPSLYKVETIGDSYMCAANLLQRDPEHAATMIQFALRAQEEAAKVPTPTGDGTMLQMRCGIHSGPAMSGIVGKIRRRFCLFGSTVNMASRTESSCPEGAIQISSTCLDVARPHLPPYVIITERGPVMVKGASEPLHMSLITKGGIITEKLSLSN
ncbi:hypothetical protein FOA52_010485 [Chlamydomonas sp. UWO 241]|nr:hypothetical protein FOA52_010485 [Chlamydomonas sp. UWO 241]